MFTKLIVHAVECVLVCWFDFVLRLYIGGVEVLPTVCKYRNSSRDHSVCLAFDHGSLKILTPLLRTAIKS